MIGNNSIPANALNSTFRAPNSLDVVKYRELYSTGSIAHAACAMLVDLDPEPPCPMLNAPCWS